MKINKAQQLVILGVQEATSWESGNPNTLNQIAEEFGYNYFLAEPDDGVLPVDLLN